jgi:hypothetical protein
MPGVGATVPGGSRSEVGDVPQLDDRDAARVAVTRGGAGDVVDRMPAAAYR